MFPSSLEALRRVVETSTSTRVKFTQKIEIESNLGALFAQVLIRSTLLYPLNHSAETIFLALALSQHVSFYLRSVPCTSRLNVRAQAARFESRVPRDSRVAFAHCARDIRSAILAIELFPANRARG